MGIHWILFQSILTISGNFDYLELMVLISHRNKNHVSYKSDTCQKDLKNMNINHCQHTYKHLSIVNTSETNICGIKRFFKF